MQLSRSRLVTAVMSKMCTCTWSNKKAYVCCQGVKDIHATDSFKCTQTAIAAVQDGMCISVYMQWNFIFHTAFNKSRDSVVICTYVPCSDDGCSRALGSGAAIVRMQGWCFIFSFALLAMYFTSLCSSVYIMSCIWRVMLSCVRCNTSTKHYFQSWGMGQVLA